MEAQQILRKVNKSKYIYLLENGFASFIVESIEQNKITGSYHLNLALANPETNQNVAIFSKYGLENMRIKKLKIRKVGK